MRRSRSVAAAAQSELDGLSKRIADLQETRVRHHPACFGTAFYVLAGVLRIRFRR